MRIAMVALVGAMFVSGCAHKNSAKVEGVFHGSVGELVMVEKLSPHGSTIIDTLRTNKDGEFDFEITFEDNNPAFVNVKLGESFVPLLLTPGEDVTLSSVGNIFNNYLVDGSAGSAKLRELSQLTVQRTRVLDSIIKLYESAADPDRVAELGAEYGRQYVELKRGVIRFVLTNPRSLASIVPLYQPLIGGRYIFDEPSDIAYFRAVADSLAQIYPSSPYVISLQGDLSRADAAIAVDSIINSKMAETDAVLPEITIKDAEGQLRSLSSLKGKVVLLDFTSLVDASFKLRNREFAEVYEKYAGQGFEIFQVCIDTDRASWIAAVVEARLRWISVCDFKGESSPAVRGYNISNIPSNFLIDRSGKIVGKNITPANLEASITGLI